MSDTTSIRRWVYDPKAPHPVWVVRKYHNIHQEFLSSCYDDAYPGDTIVNDQSTGRYWVEKPMPATDKEDAK